MRIIITHRPEIQLLADNTGGFVGDSLAHGISLGWFIPMRRWLLLVCGLWVKVQKY
ncbi:hypothetical protein [Candidatus Coxiella mudrowiae]|uniref:hypothetical protein n=1 Tax=Candidatus Coxiella mudrowiae TaxID=2054173 RepID=UPI00314519CD